jgi:cell division cycle 14
MSRIPKPFVYEVVDRVCIGQNVSRFSATKKFRCFLPHDEVVYHPYCDDFGPMNLKSITRFVEMLSLELSTHPSCHVVYCIDEGRRDLANGVFLLGAYMMLRQEMTLGQVLSKFQWLQEPMVERFRDVTYLEPDFGLTLGDCWAGLQRAIALGWVANESQQNPGVWGMIDICEYSYLDNPFNADLHVVVPHKFVAFRGPTDLGEREYSDDKGYRQFSPRHYVDIFQQIGVTTVIRLNAPEYDRADFTSNGIAHHDLFFEDCTSPPPDIVDRFFDMVDRAPGVVAVHCMAGLGRTGTLIALYMMRSCGFAPREAMGWLRIIRPGSVIGEQQHFLCNYRDAATATIATAAAAAASRDPSAGGGAASAAAAATFPAAVHSGRTAAALAAQVSSGMERRCALPGRTVTVGGGR